MSNGLRTFASTCYLTGQMIKLSYIYFYLLLQTEGGITEMGELLKLPVGIDDFEKIRKEKFYYVDKTSGDK